MEKIIIIDEENRRKWEIEKQEDELYKYTYYEYFTQTGWRKTGKETDYTKEAIEDLFDILKKQLKYYLTSKSMIDSKISKKNKEEKENDN